MLIHALNDYYDVLVQKNRLVPPEYSKVNIHYKVCLTADGQISNMIDCQRREIKRLKNNKTKEFTYPKEVVMPLRPNYTMIASYIAEHRPLYLFGLDYGVLDDTGMKAIYAGRPGSKAYKSHQAFIETSKDFFDGIKSPVVQAFLRFIDCWIPEQEVDNIFIRGIGSKFKDYGYTFCLEGELEHPLHEDPLVRRKWEQYCHQQAGEATNEVRLQCPVSGQIDQTARTHDKIKGLSSVGGMGTGGVLIGYKEDAYCSYGNKLSYNAQISEAVMKRYTTALNELIQTDSNHTVLDDVMTVYWTASGSEAADDLMAMLMGNDTTMCAESSDGMLDALMKDASNGRIVAARIASLGGIDANTAFYIVGMKPNASRITIKFMYRRQYGEVLWNIARHQLDLKVLDDGKPLELWKIKKELVSPKASSPKVDSSLMEGIIRSMICGTDYPSALLQRVLLRIRSDAGMNINYNRAAIVKACVNRIARRNRKEALTVGLNKADTSSAYLCGRLFAVLQKIQEHSVYPSALDRTIKDAYFSSTSVKPAAVFPKLMRLSQHHMKKIKKNADYYNRLIQEIIGKLNGTFPEMLSLTEQGRFIVGYYQQYQDFFSQKNTSEDASNEQNRVLKGQ